MKENGSSERHQGNELLCMFYYAQHLGQKSLLKVTKRQEILAFLDTKRKSKDLDPDERWVTTWNDWRGTLIHFFRWLKNQLGKEELIPNVEWESPEFTRIKKLRTKRLSPYSATEIWDLDELLTIVRYEAHPSSLAFSSKNALQSCAF